jgi:hypothetical protein
MQLDHAHIFYTDILVETGTYLDDMIYAMKDHFKEICSIKLGEELHARGKSAFRKYPHIHLVAGDNSTAVELVLGSIQDRPLFWLDGHYSEGLPPWENVRSPVRTEIEAIFRHPIKDHILLIDDASCFDGNHGYSTLFELHDTVVRRFRRHEMRVLDNVTQIRLSR